MVTQSRLLSSDSDGFDSDTNTNAPLNDDSVETPEADGTSEESWAAQEARRQAEEFVAMGFTERQAAYLSPDPGIARLPRLTRKEAGSYGRPDIVAQYVKELQQGMTLPQGVSMYNLDEAVPEMLEPKCAELDAMMYMKNENPDMSIVEIARAMGFDIMDSNEADDCEGELSWTCRSVLVPLSVQEEHPVDSKVQCSFQIENLQKHYGLSDEAREYIAHICDSRYDRATGTVTIVSHRFPTREENQQRIENIIRDLVKEGMSVYPKKAKRTSSPSRKKKASEE